MDPQVRCTGVHALESAATPWGQCQGVHADTLYASSMFTDVGFTRGTLSPCRCIACTVPTGHAFLYDLLVMFTAAGERLGSDVCQRHGCCMHGMTRCDFTVSSHSSAPTNNAAAAGMMTRRARAPRNGEEASQELKTALDALHKDSGARLHHTPPAISRLRRALGRLGAYASNDAPAKMPYQAGSLHCAHAEALSVNQSRDVHSIGAHDQPCLKGAGAIYGT
jgi:hypothetical protein